jgi:hypothetical protein
MKALNNKGRGEKIQEEHRESLMRDQVVCRDWLVIAVESTYDQLDNRAIFTREITIGL